MLIFGIHLFDTFINNTENLQVHTVRLKRIMMYITRTDSRRQAKPRFSTRVSMWLEHRYELTELIALNRKYRMNTPCSSKLNTPGIALKKLALASIGELS